MSTRSNGHRAASASLTPPARLRLVHNPLPSLYCAATRTLRSAMRAQARPRPPGEASVASKRAHH
eukprot:2690907-Lingulodinium_polyedra.AAC.1